MNFTIDRDLLLENLNIISRGLPSKTSMPLLYGIKMEVTNSDIYLTSSNMDISIEVMISDKSIEIDSPGKTVVLGNIFIDIIRKVNSKKIKIMLIEDRQILIEAERGEYKVNTMNIEDYPNITFLTLENPLVLNTQIIRSIIKETRFATANSEKKPILTGVNFKLEKSKNELICTATDSYRLSKKFISLDDTYDDLNITVPSKSLDELNKILNINDENVNVYFSKNTILFKYKNVLFQSRLIDGKYPDTSQVIPTLFNTHIKFNKDELIDAVERVSLLSPHEKVRDREIFYSTIILNVSNDNKLFISSSNSQIGDAKEEIIANNIENNDKFQIGFSSEYLLNALRSFDDYEIEISILTPKKPFIIKGTTTTNLIQVILPVNL